MNRLYDKTRAPAYAVLYPVIVKVAREFGYAALLHGSMSTDLDVVLVPWEEDCSSAEDVAKAVGLAIGGTKRRHDVQGQSKPHGRRCWSFYLMEKGVDDYSASTPYVDLSVVPTRRKRKKP